MKTTYYLVAAAAVAVAGVTLYCRLTGGDAAAHAAQAKPGARGDVSRLALPPVALAPDAPEPPEPAPLPASATRPEPAPAPREVKPASANEVPVPPVLDVPPVPAVPPSLVPVPKPDDVPPPVKPISPAPTSDTPPAPKLTPAPVAKTPAPKPAPSAVLQPPVAPTPVASLTPKPLPAVKSEPLPRVATGPVTGEAKFLVLNDDRLVEGVGVRVEGETVFLRQGALDRPFHKTGVQFVASSKDEVYKFMLAKVPATDAAARLKVAKWCMFSGLREQALAEAREVQRLQPASGAAADMVRSLELSLKQFPPADPPRMAAPEQPTVPTELRTPEPPASEPEPDVTPEAALVFGSRVQPFLANQCVGCHAGADYAGAFKLVRVAATDAGPQATRANLRAAAAQLKKDDPGASPLLTKTLAAHGGMKQPAVAGRQSPAYRSLEAWVALAVGAPLTTPMPATQPMKAEPVASPVPMPEPVLPPAPAPVATPAPVPVPVAVPAPPAVPVPVPVPATEPMPSAKPPVPELVMPVPVPEAPPAVPVPGPTAAPPAPVPLPAPPAPVTVPKVAPAFPDPNPPPAEVIPPVPPVPSLMPSPKKDAVPEVPPAAIPLIPMGEPKPRPKPIPPADARGKKPSGVIPASGTKFGEGKPPKPPVTGPSGDEFDPAGFNQPGK
jgi:hypothetical protein